MVNDYLFSKLALGSAQWGGSSYGISNYGKKLEINNHLFNIIDLATKNKIQMIDTAPVYGDAEKNLGKLNISNFKVVTKTKIIESDEINEFILQRFVEVFKISLENMKIKKVYGLLIHRTEDLFKKGGDLLVKKLIQLKSEGFVQKIGVSIYETSNIEEILRIFTPDIVQLPINLFDQSSIIDGHLNFLKDKNIEIHARSIFLQGLLLMDYEDINPYFHAWGQCFKKFYEICHEHNITKLEAALNFISNIDQIDRFILGFDNSDQLNEALKYINHGEKIDFSELMIRDPNIINPKNWRL